VFGHSVGGNWAVTYALAHPDRVRGLLLMEPALYAAVDADHRTADHERMIDTVGPMFQSGPVHDAMVRFLSIVQPEVGGGNLEDFVAGELASTRSSRWEAMSMEQPMVVTWAPDVDAWQQLAQPTLVMMGERTGEVLQTVANTVADLMPNAELVVLEGVDHMAPWTHPDTVAAAVVGFIERRG